MNLRQSSALLLASIWLVTPLIAKPIDLSGEWRFALDPSDAGATAAPADWRFPDKIKLPGCLTAQGFGENPSLRTQWTGEGWRHPQLFKEWQTDENFKFPFFLQPPKHYVGPAWYQRDFDWTGGRALLHLERVHWQSSVWLDGRKIGGCDSLGTAHDYDLGEVTKGRHTLTLRVDNRLAPVNVGPLSHSVTDHTQGNWNGVVGKLEVRHLTENRIEKIDVHPKVDGSLRLVIQGELTEEVHEAGIQVEIRRNGSAENGNWFPNEVITRRDGGRFTLEKSIKIPDPELWNEFNPALYTAEVMLNCGDDMPEDVQTTTFGIREAGTKDGRITINGRKTFLRGTLECCIFPLTGYPPTDVESWKRIVRICKAHGLNHIRFHSWCPPEAAFIAADELGFYYQVEVSSWANQGAVIGDGRPLDEWIEKETQRMLAAYGNHPSFLLLAYGNEPAGKNHTKWLQEWVARRKAEDGRRLYTTGAGWPIMPGSDYHSSPDPRIQGWGQGMKSIINAQPPRTDFDWSDFVRRHSDVPVISHEIGQWCVYPNLRETEKYTGYFKSRNFEIFRATAERNGLIDQADEFLKASGRLQTLAYKHDIEAALRTPGFGGFQLLDLHDFPGQGTALVGVLDAFWDEKGYVKPAEYRQFCGPIVPLARIPKMIYQANESLEAGLELAQFGPEDLKQAVPFWSLCLPDGTVLEKGKLPARDLSTGELHKLGKINVPLKGVRDASKVILSIGIERTEALNSWDLFVYPEPAVSNSKPENTLATNDLTKATAALATGARVLWTPPVRSIRDDPERPLIAGFSPIFWNTAWTNWQAPHTIGILCDPQHPALLGFPTESHSNWQWWGIQHQARPFILTRHKQLRPIVQVIDDWVTNRKLGYVFEAAVGEGKLLACGVDESESPESRQFFASLRNYMNSDRFAPTYRMKPDDLEDLIRPVPALVRLGANATASSQEPGFEAELAMDGDPATLWHSQFSTRKPGPPHDLQFRLREPIAVTAVLLTQRQDRNSNGQLAEIEILANGARVAKANVPKDAMGFRVPLVSGTRLNEMTIRVLNSHAGPYACLAEIEIQTNEKHAE